MFLERAGRWFLHSGIQENHGGVARYYRIDLARNNRISTEITGYAVSALVYLYESTGRQEYLDAAIKAGDFLLRAFHPELEVFPFEWPPTQAPEENRVFFFDGGIIIRGLLALHRLTGDLRYLETAKQAGDGLARVHEHDGNYAPILQLPHLTPLPYGNTWSNNSGCYQLKSALAWRQLADATGEQRYARYFETALERALANDASFLPGATERHRVMDRLHAYSYFLEALLSVADQPECRAALRNGINKVAHYLRDIAPEFARSDVYGQLLRVRIFAAHQIAVPLNHAQAAEEAAAMAQFQMESIDPRLDGGFCFGKRDGHFTPHANPVSTAFCLQALHMWRQHEGGAIRESWRDLI
ncbi:MAG: hypothetical protein JST93_21790 [Acidobacteria bacterium]|nr:hypothetical protein [Acidobacteriota bacterium]